MKKQDRHAAAAVWMAALLLTAGAFWPQERAAGWWCSAFPVVCGEAVKTQESSADPANRPVYRLKLAEWWGALTEK